MTTYRERLTAPLSWWAAALAFGVVWGWILRVATNWPIAITTFVLVGAASLALVWRYGSLLISVDADGFRAGRAVIGPAHVGAVEPLHRADYRHRLGRGADVRAYLVTRPYVDRGVLVRIDDPADPTPYWLVSSRRPDALAAALGHTGTAPTPAPETNGDASGGEEEA